MAKRKRRLSNKQLVFRILWILVFAILLGIVYNAVGKQKRSTVQAVLIEIQDLPDGNNLLKEGDVKATIERSFGYSLEDLEIQNVEIKRVERVLEEDPFIKKAEVFLDARDKIQINVVQRQAVLRIVDDNGLNYYLDEEGVKMPLSAHFTARVQVVTGNVPPYTTDFLKPKRRNLLTDAFELSGLIRKDAFLNAQTEQIHLNKTFSLSMRELM